MTFVDSNLDILRKAQIKSLTGNANRVKLSVTYGGVDITGFSEVRFAGMKRFRDYRSGFAGISNIKTTDPIVVYNSAYNSQLNMSPLPCIDGFESAPDAGYYFDTTTENITVVAGGGCKPPISTSGLYLYVDATNSSSYNGSGNIWYDLSGNNRDVTLYLKFPYLYPRAISSGIS